MLEDAMSDLNAHLSIFMDDLQVGSGDALDQEAWEREEEAAARGEIGEGFKQHVQALRRILERAQLANLKFKLSKCHFCQWEVHSLGLVVGCGCVRADPAKVSAIAVWPRPSREEDVERFLATMVFLRDHLSPRCSEIAKPLRDVLKQLQADRKAGKKKGKAKYRPLGRAAPDENWAPFWTDACEEAFLALKRLAIAAIEIQVPDYEGAMDGTNPLHLWPDACGFGIGAGLFQGTPKKSTDPSTYYDVLGVPS